MRDYDRLVAGAKRRKSAALVLVESIATDPAIQAIMAGGMSLLSILAPPTGIAVAGATAYAMGAIGRRAQRASNELLEGLQLG